MIITNQPIPLKKDQYLTKFNIVTDCMVSDMYDNFDTPNGATVYGTKLEEDEIITDSINNRFGFVILLKNNHFLFRDIIKITPSEIIIRDRKESQNQILNKDHIKSFYKIEEREYY